MLNIFTLVGLVSTTARSVDAFSIFFDLPATTMCLTIFTMVAVPSGTTATSEGAVQIGSLNATKCVGRSSHWEILWRYSRGERMLNFKGRTPLRVRPEFYVVPRK